MMCFQLCMIAPLAKHGCWLLMRPLMRSLMAGRPVASTKRARDEHPKPENAKTPKETDKGSGKPGGKTGKGKGGTGAGKAAKGGAKGAKAGKHSVGESATAADSSSTSASLSVTAVVLISVFSFVGAVTAAYLLYNRKSIANMLGSSN